MAAVLVGNDTNLLVLLLHHAGHQNHKIFFAPEPKKNSKSCIWDMGEIQRRLGSYVCRQLLFTHAMLGCDTTSRLHGIGKALLLKKIRSSTTLQQSAQVFECTTSSKEDISTAGERVLVELYGLKNTDTLDLLRHKKFCGKAATCSVRIEPQSLPPASAAAKYHSFRVFYQMMQWKGCPVNMLPQE